MVDLDTNAPRKPPSEDEGRDLGSVAPKESPRWPANHQKLTDKDGIDSSS